MSSILVDVKQALGLDVDNLGFDFEILMHINSAVSQLVQLGVSEFKGIVVTSDEEWPVFSTDTLDGLVKPYIYLRTKLIFDPSANGTIAQALREHADGLEGRIAHEVYEVVV